MKRLYYILFLLTILYSCSKEEKQTIFESGKVIINGHINNYSVDDSIFDISLYSKNIFNLEQYQTNESEIDSLGNFSMEFEIPNKQFVFFYYGNKPGQLYIEPNTTIDLSFDSNERDNFDGNKAKQSRYISSLQVEGELSQVNKLYTYYSMNDPIDYRSYYQSLTSSKTPKKTLRLIDSIFEIKNSYIDTFISENVLPEELLTLLSSEKEIKPITDLLQYLIFYYRPESKDKTLEENFGDEYLSRINDLPILSENDLIADEVYTTLPNYYGPYMNKVLMSKYKTKKFKKVDSILYNKELISDSKNPFFTQLMYFDRLKVTLKNNDISFYEKNKSIIDSVLKNSIFEEHVQRHYTFVKNLIENPKLPETIELLSTNLTEGKEILDEIIKNAKGKVVFIDNWATWCGPCKVEFKEATPKLKKEFKDSVEFVYFCHQSQEKLYKPTIAQYQIDGKHYFMNKEQTSSLASELNIQGFPTYSIIDKDGKLLHSGFEFRPSQENTVKILRNLISKK